MKIRHPVTLRHPVLLFCIYSDISEFVESKLGKFIVIVHDEISSEQTFEKRTKQNPK